MAEQRKKLNAEELHAFSDEMCMLIGGGTPATECMSLMLEEAKNPVEQMLFKSMLDTIYETSSIAKSIEQTGVFPDYFCHMIQMGEATGNTEEVFNLLAKHYEREIAISTAIKNAVSYPLMMVMMMLVIIVVLVTQIMPIFERVFIQLGSTMDGVSGGILAFGKFLKTYGWIFLAVIVVIALIVFIMRKTQKGKETLTNFFCHFRKIRNIYEKLQISRFSSGMAMTIGSGMVVTEAIDVAATLATNKIFAKKIDALKKAYTENGDLGKSFSEAGIFVGLYGRMATLAARRTGDIEEVMDKIANTYQEQADEEINDIISVVEPTLVIVMSLIVGLILLSVMLPLLNIMTGIN